MVKKEKAKIGAPTRAEKREQQMTDSFATLAEAMKLQSDTNAKLVAKIEGEPDKEQSRTIDSAEEFQSVAMPPPVDVPAVIYKSKHKGLKQRIVPSRIIQRSEGNPQIIPPRMAEFENNTLRTADPEEIRLIDAAIAYRERLQKPPLIAKFKDEIAEALADPKGDVKAIKSTEVTVDTPMESLL